VTKPPTGDEKDQGHEKDKKASAEPRVERREASVPGALRRGMAYLLVHRVRPDEAQPPGTSFGGNACVTMPSREPSSKPHQSLHADPSVLRRRYSSSRGHGQNSMRLPIWTLPRSGHQIRVANRRHPNS